MCTSMITGRQKVQVYRTEPSTLVKYHSLEKNSETKLSDWSEKRQMNCYAIETATATALALATTATTTMHRWSSCISNQNAFEISFVVVVLDIWISYQIWFIHANISDGANGTAIRLERQILQLQRTIISKWEIQFDIFINIMAVAFNKSVQSNIISNSILFSTAAVFLCAHTVRI